MDNSWRIVLRTKSLATGAERDVICELESPSRAAAIERASLQVSRGHGRVIVSAIISCVQVAGPGRRMVDKPGASQGFK